MNDLSLYGWNDALSQMKQSSAFSGFIHGRVSVTHRTCCEVVTEEGFITCELSGNMMYGREKADYPCTGDWVICQPAGLGKGIILDLLPRRRALYRLKSGTVSERQVIASYVDKAFIVQGLDDSFSVRRIERFMLQMADEEIQPALVLTKSDLGFDRAATERAIKHISGRIPVFFTSNKSPESIDSLREYISPGETVVFTGMSGAGKSTLINSLCRQEILPVAEMSSSTGKGRHTSTRREMVLMDRAGILIDTPGIKLFGVTNDDSSALTQVLDISSFEGECRYKDCQHINEKGCAVIRAVENGEIDSGVYENYLRLRKEAWHYTASVQEKRKKERSFSKMVREVKDKRTRDD